MGTLQVIAPGMLTTIQDRGRWGWQSCGVPVAGSMDAVSHRIANALVGNDPEAALLEITLTGPDMAFNDDRRVAVAGARFELTLNGQPMPMDAPFMAPAGSRLRFGRRHRGARAYLAVSGGIAVPPVFGSRSTHVASAMGGVEGRPLRAGDCLPLGPHRREPQASAAVSARVPDLIPAGDRPAAIRVLPGPHDDRFSPGALEALESGPYVISVSSDRMGFRLDGPELSASHAAEMISDALPPGGLQVPPSGQPILLMADRPTTGGYPCLATVITADIGMAGQLAPGDSMSFVLTSRGDARARLLLQEEALSSLMSGGTVR